jgi:hypothetical protein
MSDCSLPMLMSRSLFTSPYQCTDRNIDNMHLNISYSAGKELSTIKDGAIEIFLLNLFGISLGKKRLHWMVLAKAGYIPCFYGVLHSLIDLSCRNLPSLLEKYSMSYITEL